MRYSRILALDLLGRFVLQWLRSGAGAGIGRLVCEPGIRFLSRLSRNHDKEDTVVEQQHTYQEDEIIDKSLLLSLAILAEANGRSVTEELNIAVSSYVKDRLPHELGSGILPLFANTANAHRFLS